jgi:hypothetical protein
MLRSRCPSQRRLQRQAAQEISTHIAVLKDAEACGITVSNIKDLQRARMHSKRCNAIAWIIESLDKAALPKSLEAVPAYAASLLEKLAKKRIGEGLAVELPAHITKTLHELAKPRTSCARELAKPRTS